VRLRGYGDALCAPVAAAFIAAGKEALRDIGVISDIEMLSED
jgi:hypothetical protein